MEARRHLLFTERSSHTANRVIEPELDMIRGRPEDLSWSRYLLDLFHWLLPASPPAAKAKRSVGRELEEDWPSLER